MLEKQAFEIFFNLGGSGLLSGAEEVYPTLSGTIDNTTNRLDYDLVGKFATLEIEIYTESQFVYDILDDSYSGILNFQITDTSTILGGALPRQSPGTINLTNSMSDLAEFNITDQFGNSIVSVPIQYYTAENIQGSSAESATIQIGYLPILQGAALINPVGIQPIYQSYGAYGLTTEFEITAVNSQGSTFGISPTVSLQLGQSTITADVSFSVTLGAVNDGASIFGTYVVPKVFTYPDGSTIPSQKQTWTI